MKQNEILLLFHLTQISIVYNNKLINKPQAY